MKVKLHVGLTVIKRVDDETGELEDPAYMVVGYSFHVLIEGKFQRLIEHFGHEPYPNLLSNGYSDFEDILKQVVDCDGIELDSEMCQFFAYTDSYERAMKFKIEVDNFFEKEFETEDYLPNED